MINYDLSLSRFNLAQHPGKNTPKSHLAMPSGLWFRFADEEALQLELAAQHHDRLFRFKLQVIFDLVEDPRCTNNGQVRTWILCG